MILGTREIWFNNWKCWDLLIWCHQVVANKCRFDFFRKQEDRVIQIDVQASTSLWELRCFKVDADRWTDDSGPRTKCKQQDTCKLHYVLCYYGHRTEKRIIVWIIFKFCSIVQFSMAITDKVSCGQAPLLKLNSAVKYGKGCNWDTNTFWQVTLL